MVEIQEADIFGSAMGRTACCGAANIIQHLLTLQEKHMGELVWWMNTSYAPGKRSTFKESLIVGPPQSDQCIGFCTVYFHPSALVSAGLWLVCTAMPLNSHELWQEAWFLLDACPDNDEDSTVALVFQLESLYKGLLARPAIPRTVPFIHESCLLCRVCQSLPPLHTPHI